MASYDPELGKRVAEYLAAKKCETPFESRARDYSIIKSAQQDIMLNGLGLKMDDDSLQGTPARVAKMYCEEIFTGLDYSTFPQCSTFANRMNSNELIVARNSTILSMCEHHFVPFIGKAQIGYIPKHKLLGLSKFPRVVDFFSRRPQVQERLTLQVFYALCWILETDDVAVTMEAEHMCMRLRGVKETESTTITSQMGGRFMSKPELRQEFLALTRK